MQRSSQPPLLKRISSLFHHSAEKPAEPDHDAELLKSCIATLVDEHHINEVDAAKLVQGLAAPDLYIFLHLLKNHETPESARQKIDTNHIDVIEMRTIETPSQRML